MENGDGGAGAGGPQDASGGRVILASGQGRQRAFGSQRPGQILGEWQKRELRIARGFAECRGLTTEQLEDLYQETALALYRRAYDSEEHLRNALRDGIKSALCGCIAMNGVTANNRAGDTWLPCHGRGQGTRRRP